MDAIHLVQLGTGKRFCQQFSAMPSGSARPYWFSSSQPSWLLPVVRNRDGRLPLHGHMVSERFVR